MVPIVASWIYIPRLTFYSGVSCFGHAFNSGVPVKSHPQTTYSMDKTGDIVSLPATCKKAQFWQVTHACGYELLKLINLLVYLYWTSFMQLHMDGKYSACMHACTNKDFSIRWLCRSPELQLGVGGRPEVKIKMALFLLKFLNCNSLSQLPK